MRIVVRKFASSREMWDFMADEKAQEELKAQYPSPEWSGSLDLMTMELSVTKREGEPDDRH